MTPEQAAALRAPFPPEAIGKIPKAGIKLDYVGHAAVTDRLLSVDPEWTWDFYGTGAIEERGNDSVMWIALTVCGVTRLGVGIVPTKSFELEKQLISDAIRNAAMRFGVALDLWSKEDLHAIQQDAGDEQPKDRTTPPNTGLHASGSRGGDADIAGTARRASSSATSPAGTDFEHPAAANGGDVSSSPPTSKARREKLKSRCVALQADGISVADEREKHHLPLVDSCTDVQLAVFENVVAGLEQRLEAPFAEASK